MNYKKLETKNIYLSPASLEDAKAFAEIRSEYNVGLGLGSFFRMINEESEKQVLKGWIDGGSVVFSIGEKLTYNVIGSVSLFNIYQMHQRATLGIFISKKYQSKGYSKEAVKLILDFGFNYRNLNIIELHVYSYNKKAIKLYESLGFKKCGVLRDYVFINGSFYDSYIYDMSRDEFNKSDLKIIDMDLSDYEF